jgi:hypothetical protein
MPPAFVSGKLSTRASGTATATSCAMLRVVQMRSLPAPARNAAVAASMIAPGISGAPPTTSTRPRSSLSPSSSGCGSGHPRKKAGVMTRGLGVEVWGLEDLRLLCPPFLFRGDRGIWFGCDLLACLFERRDEVEETQREFAAPPQVSIELVRGDGAVGDLVRVIDVEDLLF